MAAAPKMSRTEGNGKIANYMAMGLPTVAFETPVAREILAARLEHEHAARTARRRTSRPPSWCRTFAG